MSESHAILFLHALTPMHPGAGGALGVVDLPIQRERHTQWPTVPGSSLKGILRDAWRERLYQKDDFEDRRSANESAWIKCLFGPSTVSNDDGQAHAGALSITDARILAFPVRSLRGVFAWVTCHAVLTRLKRDLQLAGCDVDDLPEIPKINPEKALIGAFDSQPLLVDNKYLLLEEFEFETESKKSPVFKWLAEHITNDLETQDQLKSHLVILSDDDFTHFVRHATEVTARVALDYETKTAKKGALFYEEFLPAETLFYSVILADASRGKGTNLSRKQVLEELKENLPSHLQIGGDATIGKGLCSVNLHLVGQNDE